MPKHTHADLIMEYAKAAQETEKPWERFQLFDTIDEKWYDCSGQPLFEESIKYRLKPRIIKIGEFDVPEPVREPLSNEQEYYVPILEGGKLYGELVWGNDDIDNRILHRGLIHLDAESAKLHASALISLTSK
ncbi:hypothetical protein [Xenorhabdus hominickii]|uniref:Uncharacterized protein n=1 Tax=Xenorhabdus hominickii TaxID=351679 RepID=A0A2G0Q095_XENHO|nr:hypothetical protein [Xenorhabdus hominickii]AOM42703.1 hypothetical protein A9255_20460 [Xenorhabdus hominickii]PHM52643.1 hypothetical protein Xhom_04311 [Xenorhabdus hominickii]